MKTILAPVDFSPVSESVVKEAASLARMLDGRVVLLTAVQVPMIYDQYAVMLDVAEITAAGEKNAARKLDAIEDRLKNEFIKTESVQVTENPVTAILEQAEKQAADYIVMGSHGHTAFYDLLVGSTTHGVLMHAKCPVLIVPAVKTTAKPRRTKKRAANV